MQFKEPITVTWSDILIEFFEGETRDYDISQVAGIRHAISRRLKFTHQEMRFETSIKDNAKGEQRIYVRRLTNKEVTQQQQSAERAG